MPLVLSLETSTEVCSVALHRGEELRGAIEVHIPQAHAAVIGVAIKRLLRLGGVKPADLSAVAVSGGPGSYTGLRIGTSTAKGLCFGLGLPLLSIGTLDILCYQMQTTPQSAELFCAMIDARRMEVYCMVMDRTGQTVLPAEAKIIDEQSFAEILDRAPVCFFGNGAAKCRNIIRHPNALFVDGIYPRATALGEMVFHRGIDRTAVDLDLFEPLYIKGFVAKPSRSMW